jgi:hypothetical protein
VGQPPAPEDDDTIAPDDLVYRRVKDGGNIQVVLDELGNRIASSAAFDPDEDGISVFLESTLAQANLDVISVIDGFEGYLLARIRVSEVRALGLGITRDPNPPDAKPMACNVAHCLIKLPMVSKRKTHRLSQGLAGASNLLDL